MKLLQTDTDRHNHMITYVTSDCQASKQGAAQRKLWREKLGWGTGHYSHFAQDIAIIAKRVADKNVVVECPNLRMAWQDRTAELCNHQCL